MTKKISVYANKKTIAQIELLKDRLGIKSDSALIKFCVNAVHRTHITSIA